MEQQFYMPDITDIRVDYMCEISVDDAMSGWLPKVIDRAYLTAIMRGELLLSRLRVPYLTKEHIIANGWVPASKGYIFSGYYVKNNHVLIHIEKDNMIEMIFEDPSREDDRRTPEKFRVYCECRCINDLRMIEKLFKVNEPVKKVFGEEGYMQSTR